MTKRIALTTGLALFAMFFGAGNIVYPLNLGAQAGPNIAYALGAFLIASVGLPFLGLFATSLYGGDYWKFFSGLGKLPSFLLITFLIILIGPLFAIPRTETITYHSLTGFLPSFLNNPFIISAIYCSILFCLTYRPTKVIDIIGRILSPIKLTLFVILIIAGLLSANKIMGNPVSVSYSMKEGLLDGYGTMDLLGSFFFCTIAYQSILLKAKAYGITHPKAVIKIFLQACIVGALLLSVIYVGFTLIALGHAADLQGVETAQLISTISTIVLGKYGALFVGVCVSFACIATAVALTEVTTNFIYEYLVKKIIPRNLCLIVTLLITYFMSIIGFSGIMKIALPILTFLYPVLILLCLVNISLRFYQWRKASYADEATQEKKVSVDLIS